MNASLCVHLLRSNRVYSADVVRTTLLFRYYPAWRYTDIVIVVVTEVQCPMTLYKMDFNDFYKLLIGPSDL